MSAPAIVGVELASREPQRLAEFYVNVLGFTWESATPERVCVRLGSGRIWLMRAQPSGRAVPADTRSDDGWFRHIAVVVRNMTQAYDRLMTHKVDFISTEPQTLPEWNDKSAGIEALYFRDPEGHPLELIHFPEDKGKPVWHQSGNDLFQGIDHTAIVVSSAATSVDYYQRKTGIKTAAEVVNFGAEQERLTQVKNARMHVVFLAGSSGIGLEVLDYVLPTSGRPMPADTCPDDIWWSRTVLQSSGTVTSLFRDPDGHEFTFLPSESA